MRKIFSILTLALVAMTASADKKYALTTGTSEHGTLTFKVNGSTVTTAAEGDEVTVTVTPAAGWSTKAAAGLWYTGWESAESRRRTGVDMLKDFEPDADAADENTFTFTMKGASAEISVPYKKMLSNGDITIAPIAALDYTSKALTPKPVVTDGTKVLTEGTDYTLSYEDNTNVGTAQVTITAVAASEDYSAQTSTTFEIKKVPVTIVDPVANTLTYNGESQELFTAGKVLDVNGQEVTPTEDGINGEPRLLYSIDGNTWLTRARYGQAEGTYTVYYKLDGGKNYLSTEPKALTVVIAPAALTITADNLTKAYGQDDPKLTYTAEGLQGKDKLSGALSRAEGQDVGDYAITQGSVALDPLFAHNYVVTFVAGTLTITAAEVTDLTVETADEVKEGEALPAVTVKRADETLEAGAYTVTYMKQGDDSQWTEVSTDGLTQTPGTYKVVVSLTGNYSGTAEKTFTVATNEAVGINSLTTDPSRRGEESIYTLSGRKIDGTPARKGMYIRNGKKVVIK